MKGYVNDYKMLLIEAAKSDLSLKNADNVDLFNLLQIILDREITRDEAREKAIQYSEERKTDREVVMTVAGATNSKIDYDAFGKGDGSMCTLFEEIAKENEIKGIEKGIEKGIKGMVSALKELNIPGKKRRGILRGCNGQIGSKRGGGNGNTPRIERRCKKDYGNL